MLVVTYYSLAVCGIIHCDYSHCNNLLSILFSFSFLYLLCQSYKVTNKQQSTVPFKGRDTNSDTETRLLQYSGYCFRYEAVRILHMLIRESRNFTIISNHSRTNSDRRHHHSKSSNPYPVSRNPVPVSSGSALRTRTLSPGLQCAGTHAGHLHLYGTLSSAVGKV